MKPEGKKDKKMSILSIMSSKQKANSAGLNHIKGNLDIPKLSYSGVEYNGIATVLINYDGREYAKIQIHSNNEAVIKGQVTKYINKHIKQDITSEVNALVFKRGHAPTFSAEVYVLGDNLSISRVKIPEIYDIQGVGEYVFTHFTSNVSGITDKIVKILVEKEILI